MAYESDYRFVKTEFLGLRDLGASYKVEVGPPGLQFEGLVVSKDSATGQDITNSINGYSDTGFSSGDFQFGLDWPVRLVDSDFDLSSLIVEQAKTGKVVALSSLKRLFEQLEKIPAQAALAQKAKEQYAYYLQALQQARAQPESTIAPPPGMVARRRRRMQRSKLVTYGGWAVAIGSLLFIASKLTK